MSRKPKPKTSGPKKRDGLPSRDEILEFIKSSPGRVGKREIARAFGIKGAERLDLNRLLAERLAGREPGAAEVADFLARHGRFFPGTASLDDVVDQLADRMAALQSLLRSLTPEQRASRCLPLG